MKKYFSILVATIFTTALQVFAMPPLEQTSLNESLFIIARLLSHFVSVFSQFVIFCYLILLLYEMYISKKQVFSGPAKWLRTIFAVSYIILVTFIFLTLQLFI